MKDPDWRAPRKQLEDELIAWLEQTGVRRVWIHRRQYARLVSSRQTLPHAGDPGHTIHFYGCEVNIR